MHIRLHTRDGQYFEMSGESHQVALVVKDVPRTTNPAYRDVVAISVEDPTTVPSELEEGTFFEVWNRETGFDSATVSKMNELYGLPV